MVSERIVYLIKEMVSGEVFYIDSPTLPKIYGDRIITFEEEAQINALLGINPHYVLRVDHTFGSSDSPVAVYPRDRAEFAEKAKQFLGG